MTKEDMTNAEKFIKEHGICMINFISSSDYLAVLTAMHNYRVQGRHYTEDEIEQIFNGGFKSGQKEFYEAGYKAALKDNNIDK